MLKLKFQYFGHLMWRTDSFEKTLMLGKIEGGKRRGRQDGWMASSTQSTWVWVNSESWWWTGKPGVLQSMGSQRVGHDWATELNWCTFSLLLRQGVEDKENNYSYFSKLSLKALLFFGRGSREKNNSKWGLWNLPKKNTNMSWSFQLITVSSDGVNL